MKTKWKNSGLVQGQGLYFPVGNIWRLANSWITDRWEELKQYQTGMVEKFIQECPYNVGMDVILMNPRTWEASGHVSGFNDPLMDCRECKARFRADKIIEDYLVEHNQLNEVVDGWSTNGGICKDKALPCPECGKSNFIPSDNST